MNRHVKFALVMATVTTALLAVIAIAWRIYLAERGHDFGPRPLAPLILLGVPVALAAVLIGSERHLAAHRPGISDDNPRHLQAALLVNFLFVTVGQAWMGLLYVEQPLPGGDVPVRFAVALIGVAMAVRANFLAKLSPPNLEGVSNSDGAWTRSALRTGWVSVVLGLALIGGAITLPLTPLFLACLAAGAALAWANLAHWDAVRKR